MEKGRFPLSWFPVKCSGRQVERWAGVQPDSGGSKEANVGQVDAAVKIASATESLDSHTVHSIESTNSHMRPQSDTLSKSEHHHYGSSAAAFVVFKGFGDARCSLDLTR